MKFDEPQPHDGRRRPRSSRPARMRARAALALASPASAAAAPRLRRAAPAGPPAPGSSTRPGRSSRSPPRFRTKPATWSTAASSPTCAGSPSASRSTSPTATRARCPTANHVGCDECHVRGSDHYNGLAVDLVPVNRHAAATRTGRRSPASPSGPSRVQNEPVAAVPLGRLQRRRRPRLRQPPPPLLEPRPGGAVRDSPNGSKSSPSATRRAGQHPARTGTPKPPSAGGVQAGRHRRPLARPRRRPPAGVGGSLE